MSYNKKRTPANLEKLVEILPPTVSTNLQCLKCGKLFGIEFPAAHTSEATPNSHHFSCWSTQPLRLEGGMGVLCDVNGSMAMLETLYDILCDATKTDYPRCGECSRKHGEEMSRNLMRLCNLRTKYAAVLDNFPTVVGDKDEAAIDAELAQLEAQCQAEELSLASLHASIETEHSIGKQLEEKKQDLAMHESQYWLEVNQSVVDESAAAEESHYLDTRLARAQKELDRLVCTNLINETFYLCTEGHYGTINGYRLGKVPSPAPDNEETNAAWSYMVLLLHTLANVSETKFSLYRLVPRGNLSYVETLVPRPDVYELYAGAGGWFPSARYDKAMCGYLTCVQDVVEELQRKFPGVGEPPVSIKGGAVCAREIVGQHSVKIAAGTDETWTTAMKNVMIILKWCIRVLAVHKGSS